MVSQFSLYPATADCHAAPGTRLRTVTVPKPVYDSYVRLYETAAMLTHSMDYILNHADHQNVMDMGIAMGLRMPIERDFSAQNEKIKQCLNAFGIDEIESLVMDHKGDVKAVRLPFNSAAGFHHAAIETAHMIAMAMNSFYNPDYQACFAQLKEDGKPYKGPLGFHKVGETWRSLLVMCATQKSHAVSERLPVNWVKCTPGGMG